MLFRSDTKPIIEESKTTDNIEIFAYPNNGYINRSSIVAHQEWIDKPKVYISYAYGERGNFPYYVLGKPFFGHKDTCCSETYLLIGPFENEYEATNCISYIKTKLFRFIVLQKKNTQHATSKVYQDVPLQDFTTTSDIDWSQSIADIDRQLYAKYGLSDDEIAFIEKMIKPME